MSALKSFLFIFVYIIILCFESSQITLNDIEYYILYSIQHIYGNQHVPVFTLSFRVRGGPNTRGVLLQALTHTFSKYYIFNDFLFYIFLLHKSGTCN